MLERLAGKVLDRFLSKYFEDEGDRKSSKRQRSQKTSFYAGVWSGFLSLRDLHLRVDVVNRELQAQGIPIELIHCSIRKVEMTVPWSQVLSAGANPGRDTFVLVLDGVHVLARINYSAADNNLMRERFIRKRRKVLQDAIVDLAASAIDTAKRKSWKEMLHQRLQEGLLPTLVDCFSLHIRDLHIRFEDFQSEKIPGSDPFAVGVVLESVHMQHDFEATEAAAMDTSDKIGRKSSSAPSVVYKVAELNRFGIYWIPLEREGESVLRDNRIERKSMQKLSPTKIIEALDQSISRRTVKGSTAHSASSHVNRTPQHIYLLQPVDGQWHATISTDPKRIQHLPAVRAVCVVSDVDFQIRDFQCLQLIRLVNYIREHKYSLRHRRYRPTCTVHDNPRSWWFYAVAAIRYELTEKHHRLRWSWGRFRRRYEARRRYCDLYEQRIRSISPDDAAGPRPIDPMDDDMIPLTEEQKAELRDMEDGVIGDLSVQDILLYRILVNKRLGWSPTSQVVSGARSPWFRRAVSRMVGEDSDDDEYQRLLVYWQEWSDSVEEANAIGDDKNPASIVAVAVDLVVEKGRLSLFSPLGSTSDQPQLRRLQQRFLDFTYTGFGVEFSLMGDYDSITFDICLEDFEAEEVRSNHRKYAVITCEGAHKSSSGADVVHFDLQEKAPLLVGHFTKNPSDSEGFAFGIQGRLRALAIDLVPDCEWIGKVKTLVQPIPQFRKAAKFWRELDMAHINSWASSRLGLLAKAETAVSHHKAIDFDIEIECPVFRLATGEGSVLVVDLGRADLTTEKLAGIASSILLRSLAARGNTPLKRAASAAGDSSSGYRDDSSWKTPQYARLPSDVGTPTVLRSEPGIGDRSQAGYSVGLQTGGSVFLGTPMRLNESLAVDPLDGRVLSMGASDDSSRTGNVEAYFYDSYDFHILTGEVRIESSAKSAAVISSGLEVRASLHRSIIPTDHTLCRYKAYFVVENVVLKTSCQQVRFLCAAIAQWAEIMSVGSLGESARDDIMEKPSRRSLVGPLFPDTSPVSSDASLSEGQFDEAEFFDAAEDESLISDHASAADDNLWTADSESTGSERRSRTPRRRRRQSSVSDMSSLSEGSITRRRLHFHDGEHLTAENLARLEEEAPDDDMESHVNSFHSAVSLDHLKALASELEEDIDKITATVAVKKDTLSRLRRLVVGEGRESHDSHCGTQSSTSNRQLRLDLERLIVELKALKAAHYDIVAQIGAADESRNEVEDDSGFDRDRALRLARTAAELIQSVKKRDRGVTPGVAHAMTRGLKREIFKCSVVLNRVTVQLLARPSKAASDHIDEISESCCLRVSNAVTMLRHKIGETQVHASIDSVVLHLQEDAAPDEKRRYVFVGGALDSPSAHLFTTRFPEFGIATTGDEKFLRAVFDLLQCSKAVEGQRSIYVGKLRLSIGEIEFSLEKALLAKLRTTVGSLRKDLGDHIFKLSPKQKHPVDSAQDAAQVAILLDIAFRLASVRAVLVESNGPSTALLFADLGSRFVGSFSKHAYKDKGRADFRCGNAQLLHVTESGDVVEVFGKRDLYSPLLRVRAKLQTVPSDLNRGWVLDQVLSTETETIPVASLGSNGDSASESITDVLNCHIGIKVDSVQVSAHPRIIDQIKRSVTSLLTMKTKIKQGPCSLSNQKTRKTGIDNLPVRWRADISIKELLVCIQTGESANGNIDVSFNVIATAQLSSLIRRGVILNFAVRDLSVARMPDQWTIVKPLSVDLIFEAATTSKFYAALDKPQFLLPDDFPWRSWTSHKPVSLGFREVPGNSFADSLVIALSPVVVNLSAPVCVALIDIAQSMRSSLAHHGTKPANGTTQGPAVEISSRRRCFRLRLSNISVFLYPSKEGRHPPGDSLASVELVNAELFVTHEGPTVQCSVSVANASLIDYSCKPGVRAAGMEDSSRSGDSRLAVDLSCELTNVVDRYETKLVCRIGPTQCLLLPSVVRSLFAFKRDLKRLLLAKTLGPPIDENGDRNRFAAMKLRVATISFLLEAESFELLLSSRDIPNYVRDNANESIGVVALRLKVDARATCRMLALDENLAELSRLTIDRKDRDTLVQAFSNCLRPDLKEGGSMAVLLSDLDVSVRDFQILRTAIAMAESRPHHFFVSPPAAGEQRITNSFGFVVAHQAAVAFIPTANSSLQDLGVCISHTIVLRSDFLDILVYISQSAGGMSEALRVTIQPIIDVVKRDRLSTVDKPPVRRKGVTDMLLEASVVASIRADGIKVTFVPGGATRLTESPIIKFELLRLAFGGAAAPMNSNAKLLSETSLDTLESATQRHLVAGAWLSCEASASYHNRRLVAWEPFVEPWTLVVRIGADLVRVLKLQPFYSHADLQNTNGLQEPSSPSHLKVGGRRLRNLGRLFRSPFATVGSSDKGGFDDRSASAEAEMDFCYLLLAYWAREAISTAHCLQSAASDDMDKSTSPGRLPMFWLEKFGYPSLKEDDGKNLLSTSLVCWISDTGPLNVNLTGALIENLSEYAPTAKGSKTRRLAPHWIRNDSGLTFRFHEVLDNDRVHRKEKARKVILSNGSEAPLSLRRSLSQSCDPHQAFIILELGAYEETIGRVDETDLDLSRGSRSSTFTYRVSAKVPVDTVGVHRYPLDWNVNRRPDKQSKIQNSRLRTQGWIIVRVALREGIKMVSVESPFALRNTSDYDLLCEVRDNGGLSLLWRTLVPCHRGLEKGSSIAVPADIVPFVHGRAYSFGVTALPKTCAFMHEADLSPMEIDLVTRVSPPPPYSPSSFGKGVIAESHIIVRVLKLDASNKPRVEVAEQSLHLNVCSLRLGTFALDQAVKGEQTGKTAPAVPEQRMLVFRSSLTIRNHLALPVRVQVRVKEAATRLRNAQTGTSAANGSQQAPGWSDLGVLGCSEDSRWAGALPAEDVEIRIRLVGLDGAVFRQFPLWSEPVTLPADKFDTDAESSQLRIFDSSNVPLVLSLSLNRGHSPQERLSSFDSVRDFCEELPPASRIVSIYCPFWIVDGTGLDLQYKARTIVAGQVDAGTPSLRDGTQHQGAASTLGLGELLDDSDLIYLPSRLSFQVLMIGDKGSVRLQVRRRLTREESYRGSLSPWSDPIPLTMDEERYHDTSVLPPPRILSSSEKVLGSSDVEQPYALRTRLVRAPEALGGSHGTRLIHIVCRYAVVNELGREIEIGGSVNRRSPISVIADGRPWPFHYDDSGPLCFRPKEYGWLWSGRFHIKRSRRELILRLNHELKGHSMIVSIEVHSNKAAGMCLIVFRAATHAPYRIENYTLYPLQYRQVSSFPKRILSRNVSKDTVILPFHTTEFAWDEPEYGRRLVSLQVADFGEILKMRSCYLGSFKIDSVAPGTELSLPDPALMCRVISDGPTRVLRISERSAPEALIRRDMDKDQFHRVEDTAAAEFSVIVSARLSHGVGLSVVDWQPQELLHVRLNDIALKLNNDGSRETVNLSVGSIMADNQLWVTPYPVLLRMGTSSHRRRNKRHNAVSLSLSRSLTTKDRFGDFTLLENAALSTLPSTISVDGNLVASAIEMIRRAKDVGTAAVTEVCVSRNTQLRKALGIAGHNAADESSRQRTEQNSIIADDLYTAVDYMATNAIASKLRSRYKPPDLVNTRTTGLSAPEDATFGLLSKPRHKVYVERFRVSSTSAEISWSGFLPIASSLPKFLRPALTFEGLPFLLRPYSSSHRFGTAGEHLQDMKAHYFSVWRILDLVVGVAAKPTFLVRACVFTWRESVASAFSYAANGFAATEKSLGAFFANEERKMPFVCYQFSHSLVAPVVRANCTMLGGFSKLCSGGSALFRYDAARHRASGGSVRSRNPRLFANVDGKELLVEYVEGENAGKALLSRVRMGAHLGEGYVYHVEAARVPKTRPRDESDMDPSELILMLTCDRVLLLNGTMDKSFCDVRWEAPLTDLVYVENKHLENSDYDQIQLWYFVVALGSKEDSYARALVNETGGLEALHCKLIFVPAAMATQLLSKLRYASDDS